MADVSGSNPPVSDEFDAEVLVDGVQQGRSEPTVDQHGAPEHRQEHGDRMTSQEVTGDKEPETVDGDEVAADEKSRTVVRLTGQCLTTFPRHLLEYKQMTELDLPDNLLRRLPSDIRRLTGLVRINLSHNPILARSPQDCIGLPAELASLPRLAILLLADCHLRYVPSAVWRCANLVELDISRNYRLDTLPPELGLLTALKTLDARSTGLSTVPDQVVFCRQLERLALLGNPIDRLPEAIAYLPRLRSFDVDFRRFAEPPVVDEYAAGLLRDGTFDSGHLPDALFEMPALERLNLDGAKINRLPEHIACPLVELRLARNYFRAIPSAVFELGRRLVVLDLSGNQLVKIPPEVERLVALKSLSADDNEIDEISDSIGRLRHTLEELSVVGNRLTRLPASIGSLRRLRSLNLRGNLLAALPASIGGLENLETLDVSDNRLTRLPIALTRLERIDGAHTYRGLSRRGLWLVGNPRLFYPPSLVWKTLSRRRIYEFLSSGPDAASVRFQNDIRFDRKKLIVVGNVGCGKSSLVDAVTGSCRSTISTRIDGSPDVGLVRFVKFTATKRQQDFLIVDFEGDGDEEHLRRATAVWPIFCADRAIFLVVYDHRRFASDGDDAGSYPKSVGRWIDLILKRFPLAAIQVVGVVRPRQPTTKTTTTSSIDLSGTAEKGEINLEDDNDDIVIVETATKKRMETCVRNQMHSVCPSLKLKDEELAQETNRRPEVKRRSSSSKSRLSSSRSRGNVDDRPRAAGDGVQLNVVVVGTKLGGQLDVEQLVDRVDSMAADLRLFPDDDDDTVDDSTSSAATDSSSSHERKHSWIALKAELRRNVSRDASRCWIDWSDVELVASQCGLHDSRELIRCLAHWNRTGEAVWWQRGARSAGDDASIGGGVVFPRPRRLVDILRPVFRRDLPDRLSFSRAAPLFLVVGKFTASSFGVARRALLGRGAASEAMLACLWTPMTGNAVDVARLVGLLVTLGVATRNKQVGDSGKQPASSTLVIPAVILRSRGNKSNAISATR